MATDAKAAPYAPVSNVLSLVRRFRERGLPDALNSQELLRLGIPVGSTGRTLQALRFLGLVDDEGHRTPQFDSLRLASDPEYPAALADVVRTAYAEVLTYIGDPATAKDGQLRDAFRPY